MNCRVFRSAQFFTTDHRLLVITLRLAFKIPRKASSSFKKFNVSQLRDPKVAAVYADKLGQSLARLDGNVDPEQKWSDFKSFILKAAGECILGRPRRTAGAISRETVVAIERSRQARLSGKTRLSRELRSMALKALRHDREVEVQRLCKSVERHLATGASQAAYRAIRRIRNSASVVRCPAVKAADGEILTDESILRARWAGYFEELYKADPPSLEIRMDGVTSLVAERLRHAYY